MFCFKVEYAIIYIHHTYMYVIVIMVFVFESWSRIAIIMGKKKRHDYWVDDHPYGNESFCVGHGT